VAINSISDSKFELGCLVYGFSAVWINIWTHIAITSEHSALESVSPRRQLRLFLGLGLYWLRFGERALQSECLGRHFLALAIFALHLELIGFGKELVNDLIQLLDRQHSPLPLVAVSAEVLPRCLLRPLGKQGLKLAFLTVGRLANYALVLFEALHYSDEALL
jgi:hypothetical protein